MIIVFFLLFHANPLKSVKPVEILLFKPFIAIDIMNVVKTTTTTTTTNELTTSSSLNW